MRNSRQFSLHNLVKSLPDSPGVYMMKDAKGTILYIGKAKHLARRVRQYLHPEGDGRPTVPLMMQRCTDIEVIELSSELEALLLERNLIHHYQPHYNIQLKATPSVSGLWLDCTTPWPMVVPYRGQKKDGVLLGPFAHRGVTRQALDLVRSYFPLRRCSDAILKKRTRPCLLYEMQRCCAPCVGLCSKKEYAAHVAQVQRFFRGDIAEVDRRLREKIAHLSAELAFEKAQILAEKRTMIQTLFKEQRITYQGGTMHIFSLYHEGNYGVITHVGYHDGQLSETSYTSVHPPWDEAVEQVVVQWLEAQRGNQLIEDVVVPKVVEVALLQQFAKEKGMGCAVHHPKRGTQNQAALLATQMAQQRLYRQRRGADGGRGFQALREWLEDETLQRVEVLDISHFGGTQGVGGLVCFENGAPLKMGYRRYALSTCGDDLASMTEVLKRRYRGKERFPDLLMIDGGKLQYNAVVQALADIDVVEGEVLALQKEEGRHDKGLSRDVVWYRDQAWHLAADDPALLWLQQARDEAHRFALTYQQKRRQRWTDNWLDDVPGIGAIKKKRLLRHFGSIRRLEQADPTQLEGVLGLTLRDKQLLREQIALRRQVDQKSW